MLSSTFWHIFAENILLVARAKRARKYFCFLLDWSAPFISLTKESTFEHVLAKALLPKAALLDWSAPGLRYVTAHSPHLPLLHLHHSSFYNPSFASPTSQALHLRYLANRPCCLLIFIEIKNEIYCINK